MAVVPCLSRGNLVVVSLTALSARAPPRVSASFPVPGLNRNSDLTITKPRLFLISPCRLNSVASCLLGGLVPFPLCLVPLRVATQSVRWIDLPTTLAAVHYFRFVPEPSWTHDCISPDLFTREYKPILQFPMHLLSALSFPP